MDDSTRSLLPYLPIVIALLILVRRTRRPRTLRPIRIWLGPLIVLVMSGFYLFMAVRYGPRVQPLGWLIMLGTAAVGIGLGAVRAHSVRLKRHPETGAIEATLSAWGRLLRKRSLLTVDPGCPSWATRATHASRPHHCGLDRGTDVAAPIGARRCPHSLWPVHRCHHGSRTWACAHAGDCADTAM
jgi:hypothetical protein